MGTFNAMAPEQKESAFAENVLEWYEGSVYPRILWWMCEGKSIMYQSDFHPLTNLDHAFLGVEKLGLHNFELNYADNIEFWDATIYTKGIGTAGFGRGETANEAIVEACLRIKSPHLFEEDTE